MKIYYQNFVDFDSSSGVPRIPQEALKIHKSLESSHCLVEDLPTMVQKLQSFASLRTSEGQRELARRALNALRERKDENMESVASRLAQDVAGAID